jgi:tetratricopeptide (TPR) repeat protein
MLFLAALALIPIGGALFLITASSTIQAGSKGAADQRVDSVGSSTQVSSSAAASEVRPAPASTLSDKSLAPYQLDLLDIAFDAASKFPVKPHLFTRSQTQETVVDASFELDQPRRALRYVEGIEDWRRGKGYADYAFYCAQHGATGEVQHWVDRAREIAIHWKDEPDSQFWQVDRIKVAMARAQLASGDPDAASRLETGTAEFEAEKLEAMKASMLTEDAFDHEIDLIDKTVAKGNFDMTKSALESAIQLFKKFYENVERRSMIEAKVKASWAKLPLQIRIEMMFEMTEAALDHGDRTKALQLVGETRAILESAPWHSEDRVGFIAKLAALHDRAGDKAAARDEAAEALATYEGDRDKIQNFNRAKALRPLAEAYRSMGDLESSLKIYKRVIEDGSENPNARARALDLCATCCSMALREVEPDAALLERIKQLRDGLGDPW